MNSPFNHFRNNNSLIQAIHTVVKGRARYKVSGLYQQEALKRYLEFRLLHEEIVTQVRANHWTGNVLVIFHPDCSPNAIASLLQDIVLDYREESRAIPVRAAYISTVVEKANPKSQSEQNIVESAVQPELMIYKRLDQLNNQLFLGWGAVSTLVFGTALLHAYSFDESILLAIQKLHTPFRDRIMLAITALGNPEVLLLICLALANTPLFYNRPREATTLGIAAVGAVGLNFLLKVVFGRARPLLWERIIDVAHHSFPSGHAMASMVIYGFLGYSLAKQFPQWRGRILALTAMLILAIGFSRLYLGVHWPTDVVAGYAVGLVWLIICILSLEVGQKSEPESRTLTGTTNKANLSTVGFNNLPT